MELSWCHRRESAGASGQSSAGQAQQPHAPAQHGQHDQHDQNLLPLNIDCDYQNLLQDEQPRPLQFESSQDHPHAQAMIHSQGSGNSSGPGRDVQSQLQPYTVSNPPPPNVLGGPSVSINPPVHPPEAGDQNDSYGTLMLSKGGRYKYLGPTAGTEWLKEVSLSGFQGTGQANSF